MKKLFLIILFIFIAVISALFFAQNDSMVEIEYFGSVIQWQMNWVLITVLLIGFFLGMLSLFTTLISTKVKLANANRRLALHEKEIKNLRALPIKDEY